MEYTAEVAVVFRHPSKEGIFELWTIVLAFESAGASQALKDAVSISRQTMDTLPNWRAMGYSEAPVRYAVLSLHGVAPLELPDRLRLNSRQCFVVLGMKKVSEEEIAKLTSHEDVPTSMTAMWVEE